MLVGCKLKRLGFVNWESLSLLRDSESASSLLFTGETSLFDGESLSTVSNVELFHRLQNGAVNQSNLHITTTLLNHLAIAARF